MQEQEHSNPVDTKDSKYLSESIHANATTTARRGHSRWGCAQVHNPITVHKSDAGRNQQHAPQSTQGLNNHSLQAATAKRVSTQSQCLLWFC